MALRFLFFLHPSSGVSGTSFPSLAAPGKWFLYLPTKDYTRLFNFFLQVVFDDHGKLSIVDFFGRFFLMIFNDKHSLREFLRSRMKFRQSKTKYDTKFSLEILLLRSWTNCRIPWSSKNEFDYMLLNTWSTSSRIQFFTIYDMSGYMKVRHDIQTPNSIISENYSISAMPYYWITIFYTHSLSLKR